MTQSGEKWSRRGAQELFNDIGDNFKKLTEPTSKINVGDKFEMTMTILKFKTLCFCHLNPTYLDHWNQEIFEVMVTVLTVLVTTSKTCR